MRKKTIGIFFIISVVLFIVGIVLLFIAGFLAGSTSAYDPSTGSNQITSIGNMPLFITGCIIYVLSFVPFLIAWISALVNLARQQRWLWFVLMFIFSGICLIVYLFAGPEVPSVAKSQQVQLSNQLSQSQENHSL
jgi:heme/copper-type cytochrome/quinol oxidase subunit 2